MIMYVFFLYLLFSHSDPRLEVVCCSIHVTSTVSVLRLKPQTFGKRLWQSTLCCSKMMKVSVTVKNTFVHCAFDEETDGGSTALAARRLMNTDSFNMNLIDHTYNIYIVC